MQDITYYPLTSPQLSIWYTDKMYPHTSISNVAGTLKIKEKVDFNLFTQAINLFIKNNEGIRLRLCLDDNGNPCQYISDYQYQGIEIKDFSNCEDPVKAMYEWDSQETLKPFELLNSDLYHFVILKLSDTEGGIFANIHHIISDAWAISIACNTIVDYYKKLISKDIDEISDIPMASYIEFIKNEQHYRESDRYIRDKTFWEQKFKIFPEITVLKPQITNTRSTESKRKTFIAPKKFTNLLRSYCTENKISPYPLFLSALAMYINRVGEKKDIIIGTPILNRLNQVDKNTFGMFISTIPLSINIKGEDTFSSFSKNLLELCSASYRHQRYPYDAILRHVREKYGLADNLYDIVLSYQNSKFDKAYDIDYSTRWHFNGHQSNSLTIHINDRDDEGILIIDYDYHKDLYYDKEIEFIHQHVISLLWHSLDNPDNLICKIEMLLESEKKKLLFDFNDTEMDYPREKLIHQLFEEQVQKTPDSIAIIFEDKQLTYQELNEKANSLARVLRKNSVSADSIVAIMTHRSIELVIGILGVLKAGGAYFSIDYNLPDDRINYMLKDCNVNLILTQKSLLSKINVDIVTIDLSDKIIDKNSKINLSPINNPCNLAYLIFTSGSTGNPKAVMIEHKSLNNFLHSVTPLIGMTSENVVISMATASFDIFVFELFSTLINGSKLVLTSENERTNPEKLHMLIKKHNIDIIHGTPSFINLLLEYDESIFNAAKSIIIGGEQFTSSLFNRLKLNSMAKIFNGYGPTECTIGVTFKELTRDNSINIGKPIANTQIYVLDVNRNLVPIGIPGEIYIGGDSLARGYFNLPALTDEKFIKNPFNPNEKLYKTGDIAKWYSKGELLFLGRLDYQVKINGYRIELEEIKNQLINMKGIKEAIVIDQTIQNDKRILCAYLVSDETYSIDYIRDYLSKVLPDYMIPSYIAYLPCIPLTSSGKVDRNKLPKPLLDTHKDIYIQPKSDTELAIHKIWQNILGIKDISVNDVIFDLGGDSLDVITLSSALFKKFNVEIPVADIKKVNTIRKIAQYIDEKSNNTFSDRSNQLCLLKKGKKNLFLIHAGNGEIDNYIELSKIISEEYSCWGIRMDFCEYSPQNISIHEQALKYIGYIKSIQPNGPYYLAGWCIGGTIAFEIASILECHHDEILFLALFNSIAPQVWDNVNLFTPGSELHFANTMLKLNLTNFNFEFDTSSIEGIWRSVINLIKSDDYYIEAIKKFIPGDMSRIIPRFETAVIEDIIRYVNGIRSLHMARALYFPDRKLKSNIYFFNASEDTIIKSKDDNYKKWDEYCVNKLLQFNIQADHYTLFKSPGVEELGRIMNCILEKDEASDKSYA